MMKSFVTAPQTDPTVSGRAHYLYTRMRMSYSFTESTAVHGNRVCLESKTPFQYNKVNSMQMQPHVCIGTWPLVVFQVRFPCIASFKSI